MCTEKLLESRHAGQLIPAQSRAHRIPREQNGCGFKSLRLGVASHTLVLAGERSRSASRLDWDSLQERRAGSALLFAEQPWMLSMGINQRVLRTGQGRPRAATGTASTPRCVSGTGEEQPPPQPRPRRPSLI